MLKEMPDFDYASKQPRSNSTCSRSGPTSPKNLRCALVSQFRNARKISSVICMAVSIVPDPIPFPSSTYRNYTHSEPRFRALLTERASK